MKPLNVLMCVASVVVLLSIFMPAQANLGGLGKAMLIYNNDYGGELSQAYSYNTNTSDTLVPTTEVTYSQEVYQDLISADGTVVGHAIVDYIEEEDMTVCLVDCLDMALHEDCTVVLFDCDEYGEVSNYVALFGFGRIGRTVAGTIHVTEGDFSDWSVAVGRFDEDGSFVILAASRMGLRHSKKYMKTLGRS
jgi:hypothetical protein